MKIVLFIVFTLKSLILGRQIHAKKLATALPTAGLADQIDR
jgi:hypothetical protein